MTDEVPRLLFLENRSITELWSHVAHLLSQDIDCELLQFNPAYGNKFPSRVITIDFQGRPRLPVLDPCLVNFIKMLRETDRSSYLYGASEEAIQRAILAVLATLDTLEFDFVVGEVTSIYERTVSWYCRRHGIPFLSPMSARIPTDRFFFIDGDALFPLPIAGDYADKQIQNIFSHAQTNIGKNDLASSPRAISVLRSYYATLMGWLMGERLHTPSPWRRLVLSYRRLKAERKLKKIKLAKLADVGRKSVVYCMHVQPESTLDTYSPEYSAQGRLILELADQCRASGYSFFLRLHPRGRDELQLYLKESRDDDILALSPDIAMSDLLAAKPIIVSVTGTVLIEAAIAGAPAISLGQSYIGSFPGVTTIPLAELHKAFPLDITDMASNQREQAAWIEAINYYSHAGIIAPPEWGSSLSVSNIKNIAEALRRACEWTRSQHINRSY